MTPRLAFISLEPDAALSSLVSGYKRRVAALAGDQLYLTDPPHTTLYLAAFNDLEAVLAALKRASAKIEAIDVALEGWFVFYNDALTGNHTLVCHWSEASRRAAQAIQGAVIKELAPLRHAPATEARFAASWDRLSLDQQRSVTAFGFPYTGEAWHPHLTIASIRPQDWDAVYEVLRHDPPQFRGRAVGLKLYELIDGRPAAIGSEPLHLQAKAA